MLARAVSRRQVLAVFSGVILLWLGLLAGVYRVLLDHYSATLPLHNQPLSLKLPKFMPVEAEVHNLLVSQLNHVLAVSVPVDQRVKARFPSQIPTHVTLDTVVDLNTVIDYHAEIPVSADFELLVPLHDYLLPVMLPVKLPLTFNVPVQLRVPIQARLPVRLDTPVVARIADVVELPLQTNLISQVALSTTLHTPVLARLQARLIFPTLEPVELQLANADLQIPVRWIEPLHQPTVRSQLAQHPDASQQSPLQPGSDVATRAAALLYDPQRRPPGLRELWRSPDSAASP